MPSSIIPAPRRLTTRDKHGPVTRGCRRALLGWLDRIEGARLTLVDGDRRSVHGSIADGADTLRCVLTVHHPRFYRDAVLGGHLAAAEGYVHGVWDCDDLTALVRIFARNLSLSDDMDKPSVRLGGALLKLGHRMRRNTTRGSRSNIAAHYDLGNDFFGHLLDPTMSYSAGVFEHDDTTLEEAQHAKIDRLLDKLDLRPTDRLVEIGTGWGALALRAAQRFGCRVTTTTLSRQQHDYAARLFKHAGVADRIDLRMQDYRELDGQYDKLVSVEMIEAVGHAYYGTFFAACDRLLAPGGRGVIQCITIPNGRYDSARTTIDFIKKYVFPGSCIPSVAVMRSAMAEHSRLRMSGLDDLTGHYAETLRRWTQNLDAQRESIRGLGYPEALLRLWAFYLAYCEGGFRERNIGLVHFEMGRPDEAGDR